MVDPLGIELQEIVEALGGGSGVTPPPDEKDTLKWYLDLIVELINEGGGSGSLVLPNSHIFDSDAERDAYFADHPDELIGDKVFCAVGGTLQKYVNNVWVDVSSLIKGPKGDTGEKGDDGADGANGTDGADGESAYQIWLDEGNSGSEQDFLNSLKGDKGDEGEKGDSGDPGISMVWKGSLSSPPANPEIDWAYYDTVLRKSFIYDGTQWNVIAQDGNAADYADLTNKPAIGGTVLDKDSTAAGLGLETAEDAGDNADLSTDEKGTLVGAINEVAADIAQEAIDRGNAIGTHNTSGTAHDDIRTAITSAVGTEKTGRENADIALGSRIDRVEGMGGALSAHDFGTLTPTQEALVEYYCVGIWGNYDYDAGTFTWNSEDPSQSTYEIGGVTHKAEEIFNNTWFRNTYQDSNHRFVITNTPNTTPPVFIVTDVGVDTVGEATDTLAGVAKLYNELGNNTDGAVTQAAVNAANDAKVSKSGDTMTGSLNMGNNGIGAVGVLADVSAIVAKDGNLLIKGQIELDADHGQPKDNIKNVKDPVDATDAANKGYVDTADATKLNKITTGTGAHAYMHNGETQGEIGISNSATGSTLAQRAADGTLEVATPTDNADAANKAYVDARAVPPITTLSLAVAINTASYHLLGTISRAATSNGNTITTLMVQCNVGAGGNGDYSFIITLASTYNAMPLYDLVANSRKINLGVNATRVGIYVSLNTGTNSWELYLYVPATANYVPAAARIQAVFHTAVASIFVPSSSGAAVSLPSGALQVPESKGLTETNPALGNDTRFAATNSYKLSNSGAGTLIDLGEKIASGLQVFIDAVYDETSGGNEVVHAQLSFSLYGNAASDARNGVSKQGFGHALVNAYHTILDNGHDAVWIPKQVSTHFPSVVISSAYKNTNAYTVQPTGTPLNISVTTDAEPVTALAQIANKTDTGITGWTTVSSPAASGSYSVSYSNMYLTGRYTADGKPVWRRDYRINGYVMSNTATARQDQLTDSGSGGIPDTTLNDMGGWYQSSSNYRSPFPIAGHGSSLPSYAKLMQFNGGTQILSVNSGFTTTTTLGWWVEFTR